MNPTYRAMQVSRPGVLEWVERTTPVPGPDEVLIAVEACGICGADIGDIDRADPTLQPPRVPGHEVVGRIAAIGARVPALWTLGQRVGVGRLGGSCGVCAQCRRGQFHLCQNQPFVGSSCDGGYAEMMLARASGLVAIPDELNAEDAAPILCAGIATFNALKKCGAQAGDTVAVFGIGGLGHMALQYARKMGFRVVAIGRGQEIAEDAVRLGAHRYIDSNTENAKEVLQKMGGMQALIATIAAPGIVAELMPALAPQGRLVLLGAGQDPLPVSLGHLIVGERSVLGSITGSPYENEKTLDFSVLTGVRPMIDQVKFRMVLTMTDTPN